MVFIGCIPPPDTRVIPIFLHPACKLFFQLFKRPVHGTWQTRQAQPDWRKDMILVGDYQTDLICQVVPEVGCATHMEAKRVPVKVFHMARQEFSHPDFIPGQASSVTVLEKTMKCDISAAQVVRPIVQVKALVFP